MPTPDDTRATLTREAELLRRVCDLELMVALLLTRAERARIRLTGSPGAGVENIQEDEAQARVAIWGRIYARRNREEDGK